MFITCQQCSTMFRLDESRLKPQGSKVRCSQCGNVFIATPPAEEPIEPPVIAEPVAPAAPPPLSTAAEDRELEGIDLAELDSILEKGRSSDAAADSGMALEEETVEFNEADLDIDFESALETGDAPAPEAAVDAPVTPEAEADDLDLDLDMDFELDAGDADGIGDDLSGAPLDDSPVDTVDALTAQDASDSPQAADIASGDGDLTEDVELALDDFEEALSLADDSEVALEDELETPTPEPSEPEAVAEVADDDLGLDDLGSFLDEDTEPEPEREEAELSLDEGADLSVSQDPEPEQSTDSAAGDALTDDLGLDEFGDLDSLLDGESDLEETEPEEQELSLAEDTDPGLDLQPEETAASDGSITDDLDLDDLGDLDSLLDDEEPQPEREEEDLSLSDDSELSLADEETAEEQTADAEADGDEFDLSDFDSLLEEEGAESEPADEDLELSLEEEPSLELAADEAESDDDLELSLDLEDAPDADAAGSEDKEPEALEELEFELDAEYEDKPVSQTSGLSDGVQADAEADAGLDEELDLTDIEQMLEDDAVTPESAGAADEEELDGDGAEIWAEEGSDDLGLGGDDEIDLTEIEAAIDAADREIQEEDTIDIVDEDLELDLELAEEPEEAPQEEAPQEEEPQELELELEMEDDSDEEAPELDDTEVLDMSDLDLSLEDEDAPATATETIDTGDIELEFEIEEEGAASVKLSGEETLAVSEEASAVTAALEEEPSVEDFSVDETVTSPPIQEEPAPKPAAKKVAKKKGPGKGLIFLLILAILGGGGYYGYDYVIKNDIQIPYLSDYINPKPKDPKGIVNLTTLEINSKFIENQKAGRLFVVTGKVRNGYDVPCTMILLRGKLFTKGKVLAKTSQAYAGITFTDQELASLEVADIKNRLKSPLKQPKAIQVPPRQTVPFMVIFSELPADLDEFAIELVSSTKVQ